MDLDKFERFISNSFRNVGQSFYDSYVEANVRFRSKLGMKEVIVRRQLGNCCKWCADLAGIYDANKTPSDVFKRHRNCRCLVTHKTEREYRDVWSDNVFKTQKQARYKRIEELENEHEALQQDNLKARKSKKFKDLISDLDKNKDFIKNEIPEKIEKEELFPILRDKKFSEEYYIAKVPETVGSGNVYLRVDDLAYILSRHSSEIPIEYYSKITEIIENYDVIYKDKKYNTGFKLFKLFDMPNGKVGLDLAIRKRRDVKNGSEYISHFCCWGAKGHKGEKQLTKIRDKQKGFLIDVKKG